MKPETYIERVNGFIVPYLGRNGYSLIRTEFVSEDGNWYLRLYIDLTEDELEKRKQAMAEEAESTAGERELTDGADTPDDTAVPETGQTGAVTPNGIETADGMPEETDDGAEEAPVPGISINDCVKVSRYLSKWLDKEDFIRETYTMEVCSKGFLEQAGTSETEEGEDR